MISLDINCKIAQRQLEAIIRQPQKGVRKQRIVRLWRHPVILFARTEFPYTGE